MSRERLLLVDDNDVNLRLLRAVLDARGYEVRSAKSVPEAWAQMVTFRPRAILLDLQLPKVDGLSFAKELKGDAALAEIIIVAVTSYAMKGDREKALAAGCDEYVTKPIDTRALPRLLAALLEGRSP